MSYTIGQKVWIDYHNGRKPSPAIVTKEILGHFHAKHDRYPHILIDLTECDSSTSPFTPKVIVKH